MPGRSHKDSKETDFTKLAPMVAGEEAPPATPVQSDTSQPIAEAVEEKRSELRGH